MFNPRKKNKYNKLLSFLIVNFITEDILNRLKKERPENWDFLRCETVETLKEEKFRWFKKYLVIAIQDFLDIKAGRKTNELHGTREINKDPYIFEIMELLKIEGTHNQKKNNKKVLEKQIYIKIRELSNVAKG